ncbi:MAG TPA: hypothetical protein VHG92_04720, partial [Afifellaceae bacterium]|nr:hypothetical protein [Afifellaceae bacterium]
MIARTSWSAKRDEKSPEDADRNGGDAIPLSDLIDARFDEAGRLAQIGRGQRQRIAERLDPRPPAMSASDLEQAVEKLAKGLEALERQGGAFAPQQRPAPAPEPERRVGQAETQPAERTDAQPRGRDFVAYSLDRLEARLESLSKRLEQRAGAAPAAASHVAAAGGERPANRPVPGPAEEDVLTAEWPAVPSFAVEPRRQPEDEVEEKERRRMEAMEAERRAAAADAERRAREAEAARRAEAARKDEAALDMQREFAALIARLATLQQNGDSEQLAALRHELHDVMGQVEELGRDGRSVADALDQIRARLDAMEPKVNAARNMAGNRLGELQDRLSSLDDRLGDMEAEIPGFDAVRENQ